MSLSLAELSQAYRGALSTFLTRRDEPSLSHAYELGRRAMVDGLGILDVASVHRAALKELVAPANSHAATGTTNFDAAVDAAEDFYAELLSPFEMSLRGYRGANEDLRRLNHSLSQQKQQLEIAHRELESFSYSVSHDLRAPLRNIESFSTALAEDYAAALDQQGNTYLRYVREAALRMGQLIEDLLGLARVTRTEPRRTDVDLSAPAGQLLERLQRAAPQRRAVFSVSAGIRAHCDAGLVTIVLENLLGNSWKFTAQKDVTEIAFGCEEREGVPTYFVKDNGAGFDMKYAAKLFGAFQRLHPSQDFEGTGIGLATVHRAISRHNGRVWAEAKVGAGATFYFTLGSAP